MLIMNQEFINSYFSNHWNPGEVRGITSPESISKLIMPEEWLLDVGCGKNPFKLLLPNVVGIDPAFKEADIITTIEQYKPDRLFDVATCLGSINFGNEEAIAYQIERVVECLKLKSRIYWRLNPGRKDHDSPECQNIDFFPWTHEKLSQYANKHGYKQLNEQIDGHEKRPRLYAEWHRAA